MSRPGSNLQGRAYINKEAINHGVGFEKNGFRGEEQLYERTKLLKASTFAMIMHGLLTPYRQTVTFVLSFCVLQVPKLIDFLRSRSLRPGLGKLPIVAVIVVIDANDPRYGF